MRRFFGLLLLSSLSGGALAADAPKRLTWERHFEEANQAHDGHLTLEQAKGGFGMVAKHFNDIDVDHKGYVTENDIRAWRVMRKAGHRLMHQPADDRMKPRNAMQLTPVQPGPVQHKAINASTTQIVPVPGAGE